MELQNYFRPYSKHVLPQYFFASILKAFGYNRPLDYLLVEFSGYNSNAVKETCPETCLLYQPQGTMADK